MWSVILKELLTRQFELEIVPDDIPEDGETCSVCSNDENDMIKCKVCLKFFHPKCVGRKTMAKPGTYKCKACRKNEKNGSKWTKCVKCEKCEKCEDLDFDGILM